MKASLRPLAAAALLALALCPADAAERRISVQGRASIEVVPDIVTVSVGVTTRAAQATTALDQNSAAAGRIIDFAKRFGVQPADIRTSAVSLTESFRQKRDPNGQFTQEPDGYTAVNSVSVRLRDLTRLGVFMRDVIEQGANRVSGVQFGLAEPDKFGDEVRKQAVEDAKRKAALLADAAGARLGAVQAIRYPPRLDVRPMGEGGVMPAPRALAASVPVEAGVLAVAAEVDVTWMLE